MTSRRIYTDEERKARKAAYRKRYRAENYESVRAKELADAVASNARAAKWRAENKERMQAYFKARYEQEKAEGKRAAPAVKARAAAYYQENKERIARKHAEYKRAHPHVVRNQARKRRALVAGTGGQLSVDIEARLLKLQRGKCANCNEKLQAFHVDHIKPIAKGGANVDSNVQLLCPPCNLRKHAKDPIAFAQEQGRLL